MLGQLSGFVSMIMGAYFTRRADQPQIDAAKDERLTDMVAALAETEEYKGATRL